jgi:hypothetical protein
MNERHLFLPSPKVAKRHYWNFLRLLYHIHSIPNEKIKGIKKKKTRRRFWNYIPEGGSGTMYQKEVLELCTRRYVIQIYNDEKEKQEILGPCTGRYFIEERERKPEEDSGTLNREIWINLNIAPLAMIVKRCPPIFLFLYIAP